MKLVLFYLLINGIVLETIINKDLFCYSDQYKIMCEEI